MDRKQTVASARSGRARKFEMAPVARAVRAVLALSATTLALGASGAVFAAGTCAPAGGGTVLHCDGNRQAVELQPVVDLTRVMDDDAPGSVVEGWRAGHAASGIAAAGATSAGFAPTGGDVAAFGAVQDLVAIPGGLMPGPGGASGADDSLYINLSGTTDFSSNTGVFSATTSTTGFSDFAFAHSNHFTRFVNNADISATGYTWAAGLELEADTYAHDIGNSATGIITTRATGDDGQAWGIYAVAGDDVQVYNDGSITTIATGAYGTATGLFAYSIDDAASADNTGTITSRATGDYGQAWGIYAAGYGDVSASNSATGTVIASAGGYYGRATGISAYSIAGDASIGNDGLVRVTADTDAIGLYGYAYAGTVGIDNTGTINVRSDYGLADGIFASGAIVDVGNSGTINAIGYSWAAGIEAEGGDQVTVDNSNRVVGIATGSYGEAFGIYATGGDAGASVTNSGYVRALGSYSYGISVDATGPASVTNSTGTVRSGESAYSYLATGIDVHTDGGDILVDNGGDVLANSIYGSTGISASADGIGNSASVNNSGYVYAATATKYGYGATGIVTFADGDSSIGNSGSVLAYSDSISYGALALSFNGTASVDNSGDILAVGTYYGAYGALAASTNGAAGVDNSGSIIAASLTGSATGVQVVSQAGSDVDNSGDVVAYSMVGYAVGLQADSGLGDSVVDNSGTVSAYSSYYVGRGIQATSDLGDAVVTNSGLVNVEAKYAYGVFAASSEGDVDVSNAGTGLIQAYSPASIALGVFAAATLGDVSIDNAGSIAAYAYSAAFGAYARSTYGNALVSNSGDIVGMGYDQATGILASSTYGIAAATNAGTITSASFYQAVGIFATSDYGSASVANAGAIDAYSYAGPAVGVFARADYGDVGIDNGGAIVSQSLYGDATGILASGLDVSVSNGGSIAATGYGATGIDVQGLDTAIVSNSGVIAATAYGAASYGFGIYATSNGDASVHNSGTVLASADYLNATGIYAGSVYGDVSLDSSGSISADSANGSAVGLAGASYMGGVVASNTGAITAHADHGGNYAIGLLGNSLAGDVSLGNGGSVSVSANAAEAIGAFGNSFYGAVSIANGGSVDATSAAAGSRAIGLYANAYAAASIANAGTIEATATGDGGTAYGVVAQSLTGAVTVSNSGTINASDATTAIGISMVSATGSTLLNTGTVQVFAAPEGEIAVLGGDGTDQITNQGDLHGALVTAGGDDLLSNADGGTWFVDNHATDFGGGNDTIDNLAGGTIHLIDGAINLGSSTAGGNAFHNAGMLLVSGEGTIDMGSGPALAPLSLTQSAVPSLNAQALVNDGVIDFLDGATDDILTITGDLDGGGAINLDVSALNGTSDTLYVDGSIADGAAQVVNATFQGVPSLDDAPVAFAYVSGDSSSTSFVSGTVVGFNANNFINLKTEISSTIDASNASADVFSVGVAMDGLNGAGMLAASIASGAHSLINSQVGTWRQRTGVLPQQQDGGLSAWIRGFSDDGEVDQQHVAVDFTDAGDFRFQQSNQGSELGMNFALPGGFNYGVLLAKAHGDQRVRGVTGGDRIDLSSVGVYGTWISSLGFYLDASYRWMDFDAKLSSVGGTQSTSGNATAFNLEAGYSGWQVAGIDIVPQAQYTRTEITNIDALHGDTLEFAPVGGDSTRGRVGVGLEKAITRGSAVWTPYGSVNAVREFDGENRYTVAGDYHGLTRTDGTSAMVELGLGVQNNGFSVTGGLNWTDGGAQHDFFGGQLVVRYSW